jgi:hypothetical protein
VNYFDLVDYYKNIFLLTNTQRLSIFEIEHMYPWEYEIYINMLNEHLEKETTETQQQLLQNKF